MSATATSARNDLRRARWLDSPSGAGCATAWEEGRAGAAIAERTNKQRREGGKGEEGTPTQFAHLCSTRQIPCCPRLASGRERRADKTGPLKHAARRSANAGEPPVPGPQVEATMGRAFLLPVVLPPFCPPPPLPSPCPSLSLSCPVRRPAVLQSRAAGPSRSRAGPCTRTHVRTHRAPSRRSACECTVCVCVAAAVLAAVLCCVLVGAWCGAGVCVSCAVLSRPAHQPLAD
jgi:hypothetical protein